MSDSAAQTAELAGTNDPRRSRQGDTRARILDAATGLIYANGIRGTSADRVIELAGITKVTFYRHFRTKTDLVVAYLERQAAAEKALLNTARSDADAVVTLQNIAGMIGTASCMPGFRGCPFINAAAETADPTDPVRVVVDAHRLWTRELFASIAEDARVPDPDATAGQLMMLRDGAMISGYLSDPDLIAGRLQLAYAAILAAAQHRS